MVVIGDLVRDVHQLAFQQRRAVWIESDRTPFWCVGSAVLVDALPRFPSQVEAWETGVAGFQAFDHPEPLEVVIEAPMSCHEGVQGVFPRVAERRMPNVMREGHHLHQILIELERPGDRTGNLGHLERVRQPRAVMIAFMVHEHLCFILQTTKRGGVDDAVTIPSVDRPEGIFRLGVSSAPRVATFHGIGSEPLLLTLFQRFPEDPSSHHVQRTA